MANEGRLQLSEGQKEKFVKHLHTKVSDVDCQWCGKNEWMPSQHAVAPLVVGSEGGLNLGRGPLIPWVFITCGNCGNTMFFNAVVMGVYPGGQNLEGENNAD